MGTALGLQCGSPVAHRLSAMTPIRIQRLVLGIATALAIVAVMVSMIYLYVTVPETRSTATAWGMSGVVLMLYLLSAYLGIYSTPRQRNAAAPFDGR